MTYEGHEVFDEYFNDTSNGQEVAVNLLSRPAYLDEIVMDLNILRSRKFVYCDDEEKDHYKWIDQLLLMLGER